VETYKLLAPFLKPPMPSKCSIKPLGFPAILALSWPTPTRSTC